MADAAKRTAGSYDWSVPPQLPPEIFDRRRLLAVQATELLDTAPEEPFDNLARLAAELLDAPSAFVTLVDDRRSFLKSCIGADAGLSLTREIPADRSFCQYVVGSGQPLVVGDARRDERTRANPAIAEMGVVAWAGFPICGPGGMVLGTLCVVDTVERHWSDRHVEVLRVLSAAASTEIALRTAVSEERAARAEAALASAYFRVMADSAPVLMWLAGTDAKCSFFNRGWLDFTGRSHDQELGDGWREGLHPRDVDRCLTRYLRAFERREPFEMDYRLRRAGGDYRWVLHRGAPVYDTGGTFSGYVGACIDVTERRQAQDDLRRSREELRLALAAGKMGTWTWDRSSGYVSRDPNLLALYGLESDAEPGTYADWVGILHPEDRARVVQAVERSVAEGGSYDIEHRIVRPDGTVRWVERRGQAYWDEAGAVIGTRGLVVDITSRKEADVERSRLLTAEQQARRAASHIAQTLQQSLLPPTLPLVPGLEVAAWYKPLDTGSEVGGDFYDIFPAGPSRWGVVIGDVSGKGVPAASLTALARYTVRTAAAQADTPSAVLEVLNRSILDQDPGERFCTIAHAVIEQTAEGSAVTLSRAGHPPPLLLQADGDVRPFGRPGMAVGLFGQPALVDDAHELVPGEALVFYTDGLLEARAPDGAFADGLLELALSSCAGASAEVIAGVVHDALVEFQGGRPRDDMALLVVRRPADVFHRHIGPEAAAVSTSRRVLAPWLASRLPSGGDDMAEDLLLVVSELMTNSARVAVRDVQLHLWAGPDEVVIDVYDDGPGFDSSVPPSHDAPDPLAPGGRGLYIVHRLMDDCRVQSGPSGTLVRCRTSLR